MATRILSDSKLGAACLYDSTTGVVFGPLIDDLPSVNQDRLPVSSPDDLAAEFLGHLRQDLGLAEPGALAPQTLLNVYRRWRGMIDNTNGGT